MLECVINISEGEDSDTLKNLAAACGQSLLDVHSDAFHNRSVFTLAGPSVEADARSLALAAIERLDIRLHRGVHPRIGVVDVVPFVPLAGSTMVEAIQARDDFARWIAYEADVPAFQYGPERTLPQVRKQAFDQLAPLGSSRLHPTAGAVAVGARDLLVAYNLWLVEADLNEAKHLARTVRSSSLRTLGLAVGDYVQVSCNLVDPTRVGPAAAYDAVAALAGVKKAELVGLISREVLKLQPRRRWDQLDLDDSRTIEARLDQAGLDKGKV